MSPSIKDLTGYVPSAFYGNPKFYLNLVSEIQVREATDIFDPKVPFVELQTIELCRKNGEKFWGEISCTLIEDEDGNATAVQGTIKDVTKIKTVEMEQLEDTKRRNMLLSYFSHEFRTPITSIAGYLTAITDGTMTTGEEKMEAMDIITSKTLTLKKLVDDLDQLTKIETNQFSLYFATYTAAEATEMMISSSVGDAESAGFEVALRYDEDLLSRHWVIIDTDKIKQVFSNLINNSIKYSETAKNLWITFDIDDKEESFVVSVKDNGIGIRDKHLPHIFERFYRADANENTNNTICRRR